MNTALSPSTAKRARRKEARPGELLDAALELFVEHGYAGTRVEAVARRAGVSKGTLFLYFPSKEALFKAVVLHHLSQQLQAWNTEFDAFEGSSAELVRQCLRLWWERLVGTRLSGIAKLVMTESAQFPEIADIYQAEVIDPGNALLRRVLQRGVDRGEFRPLDLDYGIYALIAPMMLLLQWKHGIGPCSAPGRAIDPLTFIDSQADTLLQGLLLRPGPQSPPGQPHDRPLR